MEKWVISPSRQVREGCPRNEPERPGASPQTPNRGYREARRTADPTAWQRRRPLREAAAHAADRVRPGETVAAVRARLEADGECPYYVSRVLALASLKGAFGEPYRDWVPTAIQHLAAGVDLGDVRAGRLACHLANEAKRYLLEDRPMACLSDGGRALQERNLKLRLTIEAYTRCRSSGHALRACLGRAIADIGGERRARLSKLLTRLGDVEATNDQWDIARAVWQAAEQRGELGAYERARFGIPPETPNGSPVNPTIHTIIVAAGGG